MTANQIAYWNYVETARSNLERERNNRDVTRESIRHNKAYEKETNRHNVVSENIGWGQLSESKRHNLAYEKETNRHNLVSERQSAYSNWELHRHNVSSEKLGYANLNELARHNQNSERIQEQGNYLNYNLGQLRITADSENNKYRTDVNAAISKYGVDANYSVNRQRNDITQESNDIRNLGQYPISTVITKTYNGRKAIGNKASSLLSRISIPKLNYHPYSPGWAAK